MEDQKLKDLLDNYEVQFNPEHWNKMKSKLEEAANVDNEEDKQFDRFVKAEVGMQQTPFNPAHWDKMSQLVEKKSFAGRVRKYRLLEVLCLLLLIWTTWFVRESVKVIDSVDYAVLFPKKTEAEKNAQMVQIISLNSSMRDSLKPNLSRGQYQVFNPLPIQSIAGIPNIIASPTFKTYPVNLNSIAKQNQRSILYGNKQPYNDAFNKSITLASLNSKFYNPTGTSGLRLGVYASSNFDETSALNQEINNEDAHYALGMGAGLSVAWKLDRLELETGAAFNSVRELDFPKEDLAAFDDSDSKEKKVTNLIRLPLVLKYLFKDYGKWKIYALGGGNLHLDITQSSLTSNSPDPTFAASRSKKSLKNLESEPSSFIDRFYYTTTVGVGVERKLTDKFSVFVQPEYFHQLNRSAIDPLRGPSNSFAISMGLKTFM